MGERMTKSFLRVVNELSEVSSLTKKKKLSDEASIALEARKDRADSVVVPIIEQLERLPDVETFKNIASSEFYEMEIRTYYDDELLRISVQIAFLQDFEESMDGLSEKIGFQLYNELLKRNLDILINDICVNDVQYRNGTKE